MKYFTCTGGPTKISQMILGCMRLSQKDAANADQLVMTAIDQGINYFDHADIYGAGESERVFGEVLQKHKGLRETLYIQTKCGICKGSEFTVYDLSKTYIVNAVDRSLQRLRTEYVDTLLLHRPDALLDADEIGEAFEQLYTEGKVKYFGLSNINAMQFSYLQKHIPHKLLFNQLQFNPVHAGMIDQSLHVNMDNPYAVDRDSGILDYCRLHEITVQAWSILQAEGTRRMYIGDPDFANLNAVLQKNGDRYGVLPSAVVAAWILRHPAKIQPIVGTTSPAHLKEICAAADMELTRPEWYEIYLATGKKLP